MKKITPKEWNKQEKIIKHAKEVEEEFEQTEKMIEKLRKKIQPSARKLSSRSKSASR